MHAQTQAGILHVSVPTGIDTTRRVQICIYTVLTVPEKVGANVFLRQLGTEVSRIVTTLLWTASVTVTAAVAYQISIFIYSISMVKTDMISLISSAVTKKFKSLGDQKCFWRDMGEIVVFCIEVKLRSHLKGP